VGMLLSGDTVFCPVVASHLPWILHFCRQQHLSFNLCKKVKKRDCCTRRCNLTFYCRRKNILVHQMFLGLTREGTRGGLESNLIGPV
jgi:hypothetical protein